MSKLQIYSRGMEGKGEKMFKMSVPYHTMQREKNHSLICDMKIYRFNNFWLAGEARNFWDFLGCH